MENKPRIRLFGVLLKASLLFMLFNFAFIFLKGIPIDRLSLYNSVFPGRERFPFEETRESYNLSLFDVDAMFASHVLNGVEKAPDEYRVLLIGLWHGLTVNFVLWGLWHGFGLFFQNRWSDFAKTRFHISNPRQGSALRLGGIFLTFNFVALGCVSSRIRKSPDGYISIGSSHRKSL